jgi:hypothetical protein
MSAWFWKKQKVHPNSIAKLQELNAARAMGMMPPAPRAEPPRAQGLNIDDLIKWEQLRSQIIASNDKQAGTTEALHELIETIREGAFEQGEEAAGGLGEAQIMEYLLGFMKQKQAPAAAAPGMLAEPSNLLSPEQRAQMIAETTKQYPSVIEKVKSGSISHDMAVNWMTGSGITKENAEAIYQDVMQDG